MIMYSASSAAGWGERPVTAPLPSPAAQRPVPPPTDPHSHEGLCSRDRRSATDFFLARAAALRLSRSRMSRKDRRSESSLSKSAGHRDVHHTPSETRVGSNARSMPAALGRAGKGFLMTRGLRALCPRSRHLPQLCTIPLLMGPGCRGRMRRGDGDLHH